MPAAAAIDHHQSKQAPPLEVFIERCRARASLVASNMMDLPTAVDSLQEAAERTGLVDELGQDAVQKLMSDAFARRLRDGYKRSPADCLTRRDAGPPPYRTAASTIDAFWYVVGLRDQERFKTWLADHPQDAPFLLKLLEGK